MVTDEPVALADDEVTTERITLSPENESSGLEIEALIVPALMRLHDAHIARAKLSGI